MNHNKHLCLSFAAKIACLFFNFWAVMSYAQDVSFSIPTDLTAAAGDTVKVPLYIDPNNNSVGSFDVTLEFDKALLTYTGYTAGPIVPLSFGWIVDVNVGISLDKVTIGAFDAQGETNSLTGSGVAVLFEFVVSLNAPSGAISDLFLSGLSATDINAVPLTVKGMGGRFVVSSANAQAVLFSIPSDLEGTIGDTVLVPVHIDPQNNAIGSFDLTVMFDQKLLAYTTHSTGPLIPTSLGWTIDVNGNNANGVVTIGALDLAGETNSLTASGVAVFLKFLIRPIAEYGDSSDLLVKDMAATDTNAIPLSVSGTSGKVTVKVAELMISGRVSSTIGKGIPQVTISFSNNAGSTVTDQNGNYTKQIAGPYSGTATPSKSGYSFQPPFRTYTNITISQSAQDFVGTAIDTVFFSIPSDLKGSPGDTVDVPLNIDPKTNKIGSFDAAIAFGTDLLSYVRFTSGPIVPVALGWTIDVNENSTGRLTISAVDLAGETNSLNGAGTALFLEFVINSSAKANDTTALLLNRLSVTDINAIPFVATGKNGKITVVQDTKPPDVPNLINPRNRAENQPTTIILIWTESVGANIYHLQVATDSLFISTFLNDSTETDTTQIIGPLKNRTKYYWRVRASNSNGKSNWSDIWNFTTIDVHPEASSNLTVRVINNNQIELNWQDNSDNEQNFKIERKISPDTAWKLIDSVEVNSEEYYDGGLTDGTRYFYRIYAQNGSNKSNYSNEAHATTPMNAPSDLIATAASDTQINLEWVDNSKSENGYRIESKSEMNGNFGLIDSVGANVMTYSQHGLKEGKTSYYRVQGFNNLVSSAYSNVDSAKVEAQMPDISASPASWDFGLVTVGNSSEKSFVIINEGAGLLQIQNMSITETNDFRVIDSAIPFALSPRAAHEIRVQFSPASRGAKSAILRLDSNDPDENPFVVSLNGIGDEAKNETYAFPTPFNPQKEQVQIYVPSEFTKDSTVKIFDSGGTVVIELVIENSIITGTVRPLIKWNGRNRIGDYVANGVYHYVIDSGGNVQLIGKIAVVR